MTEWLHQERARHLDPDTWILGQIPSTLVGAWVPCRLEITENHPAYGHLAVYCQRYWGSEKEKPRDYGDSVCPKADAFIEEHREQWRLQSQNAPLTTNSDRENDVNENEGRDMGIHEDKNISLNKTQAHLYLLENTPSVKDYHDGLRFLYAFPGERVDERHPVLIRKEYLLLYDKMKSLHQSRHIAILTGQPGIGNMHPCPLLHLRS